MTTVTIADSIAFAGDSFVVLDSRGAPHGDDALVAIEGDGEIRIRTWRDDYGLSGCIAATRLDHDPAGGPVLLRAEVLREHIADQVARAVEELDLEDALDIAYDEAATIGFSEQG